MLILSIFLISISIGLNVYISLALVFEKEREIARLKKYINTEALIKEKEKTKLNIKLQPRKILNLLGEKTGDLIFFKKYIKRNQEELIKAGIPLKGEELLVVQITLSIIIGFIFSNLLKSLLLGLIISVLGFIVPKIFVKVIKNKRYKLFNEQLSDVIVLISNSLKAGHSFFQALDSVARETPEPICKEFEKVLKEIRLGVSTEKALENLLLRIESDDLGLMITAVLIQRQIGGNLSEILDNISSTIRERIALKGEINTLTAQGRLSGIVIGLLPVVVGSILLIINPDYIKELFNNKIGIFIICAAFISQTIGIVIINKIIKIEI